VVGFLPPFQREGKRKEKSSSQAWQQHVAKEKSPFTTGGKRKSKITKEGSTRGVGKKARGNLAERGALRAQGEGNQ